MNAVLDVSYEHSRSIAACVMFRRWGDAVPAEVVRTVAPAARGYRVGRFYERELPCLLAVLDHACRRFDTVVIDGYVHLDDRVGKGLGAHLFESLPYRPAVVGVAKRPLAVATGVIPVYRGASRRPLYVSAAGWPAGAAAAAIEAMHGPYRLPTLLKLADRCARAEADKDYLL